MAEKLDPKSVVTFEELLRAMMMEQDATRRVLVRMEGVDKDKEGHLERTVGLRF